MKEEIEDTYVDPDLEYECQYGMNKPNIESDDFYDELWGEMLVIDKSIQNYLEEFKIASRAISPKQAVAIYWHSSVDAEESLCPLERRHEILNMMWGSNNLLRYGITDYQEFRKKIENIDPFSFYVFTEILYKTELIICQTIDQPEPLKAFIEKVKMLKKMKRE